MIPLLIVRMPHARWWDIEDGRTNFGDIKPGTTDLAQLLFIPSDSPAATRDARRSRRSRA
jgi:hypothetical protein